MSEPLMKDGARDGRREAIARHIFEESLRQFVREWAPTELMERDNFHRDLTMLMRDAMQSQAEIFSVGVDHYVSLMLRNKSLQPLNVIFEKPTKGA